MREHHRSYPHTVLLTLGAAAFLAGSVSCGEPEPTAPVYRATGEVGPLRAESLLLGGRGNHCSAVAANHLVVIGGNARIGGTSDFETFDDVLTAPIDADGRLGSFRRAGQTPSPVLACTATGDGDTLYLVSGSFDDPADSGQIFRATVGSDGTVSAFTTLVPHPAGPTVDDPVMLNESDAWVRDGALYVNATMLPQFSNSTMTARLDLASLTWSTTPWAGNFRYGAAHAFAADHFFMLGGYGSASTGNFAFTDAVSASATEGAILDPASLRSSPLAEPTVFGDGLGVDDWVFVFGGRAEMIGGTVSELVHAAQVQADGALGAWRDSSLPMPLQGHDVALFDRWLYITGGTSDGIQVVAVHSAQVRF